ncbi:MAG: hypothetical protein ACFFDJ_03890 [Candidatus Odinarchaeota archaeon]
MCGSKEHHFGFRGMAPFISHMCCGPEYEPSKESQIKGLEAMKARLEDYLKHIDERISDLEKEGKK